MSDRKSKDGFEPHVPLDLSVAGGGRSGAINLPIVMAQIDKIKNNPSMVKTYFATLRASYKLSKEIEVINKLEEYCTALASGISSQAQLVKMQTELVEAQRQLLISQEDLKDIDDELEIRKLRRDVEKAGLLKQKRDLEKGASTSEEDEDEKLLKTLSGKLRRGEIEDEYDRKVLVREFQRRFLREQDLRKAMERLAKMIKQDPQRDPEDIERDLKNLQDLYERMKVRV